MQLLEWRDTSNDFIVASGTVPALSKEIAKVSRTFGAGKPEVSGAAWGAIHEIIKRVT